ncbi:MAG: hypothetical protein PHH77_11090 [Victivallaceae bacterium]|nr:hypothetical protein [Victivallaceae bacterium]
MQMPALLGALILGTSGLIGLIYLFDLSAPGGCRLSNKLYAPDIRPNLPCSSAPGNCFRLPELAVTAGIFPALLIIRVLAPDGNTLISVLSFIFKYLFYFSA